MEKCPVCGGETCEMEGKTVCNGANDCTWEQPVLKCLFTLGMGTKYELTLVEAIAAIGLLANKRVKYAGAGRAYHQDSNDFEIKIGEYEIVERP